ncbi:MAG: translation elongation factor Ts [Gemmatimonadota bacterium]|jgi:elongation factor Ts|nr:translation elongation factor Ts [Gemmatimonadota bacterium]MDQ8147082.1 translation elongation factor Ts [Gemmatimonadota bacterium]MDQ8148660.1 translation elongation factor Ts [Gemmatimonadota bacterium]MDQ8176352.1 translation elongation factor Ts [Gemmatimonadota bacterium]
MSITAKDVADLRARTGAGMMDCKKALEETSGNMDAAVDLLRKKGIAKAEKRADRAASEGQIVIELAADGKMGAMIELNCETDFVGRNDEFVALAKQIAQHVAQDTTVDGLVTVGAEGAYLTTPWAFEASRSVGEVVKAASAKTGEKVELRRVARFATAGLVGSYLHFNGKAGVLAEITGGSGAEAAELGKHIAEHVAAGVPSVAVAVDESGVDPAFIARERDIFVAQAVESGKPQAIAEKMVEGRIAKLLGEITLLGQPWVRDDKQTIKELVAATAKTAGQPLAVTRFVRFKMGEA